MNNISINQAKRFLNACNIIFHPHDKTTLIGTLGEKQLHAMLKLYIEENKEFHEQKVASFYADIKKDNHIYEIQTRSFNKLRVKLECFLKDFKVTIVYPIPYHKWITWIDTETGVITNKRKSPKTGNINDSILELYKIKMFLNNPNLSIKFILIDLEEQRLLNGWNESKKRGSSRFDRIPLDLIDEIDIDSIAKYNIFIPDNLPTKFTTKDFKKYAKINQYQAQLIVNILFTLNIIKRVDKIKNLYVYEKCNNSI